MRAVSNHDAAPGSWIPQDPVITRVGESGAPNQAHLLGAVYRNPLLMGAPSIGRAITRIDATVRGAFDDPLHPATGRARRIAEAERSFDVFMQGGGKLTALEAASSDFVVRLTSPNLRKPSTTILLPMNGGEDRASVQTTAHSPDAPAGFYNAPEARRALQVALRVLEAARNAPETSQVNQMRAGLLVERLQKAEAFIARIDQAATERPALQAMREAQVAAYAVRKPGDEADLRFAVLERQLSAYLKSGAEGLAADLLQRAKDDLKVLTADHDKWLSWHQASGPWTFWVEK